MKNEKGESRTIYYFRSTFFKLFTFHVSRFTFFFVVHVSLFTLFIFLPSAALCDMRQFIPRITDYAGDVETDMKYQGNGTQSGTAGKWSNTSTLLSEGLNLALSGYVYHPRFIIFVGTGTGGFQQAGSGGSTGATPLNNSFATQYELRARILPQHPYNLELYTSRQEPFTEQSVYSSVRPVTYEKGAIFNYQRSSLFFNGTYRLTTNESSDTTNSTTTNVSVGYNIGHAASTVAYSNADTSSVSGRTSSQSTYNISNQLNFEKISLLDYMSLSSILGLTTNTRKDPSESQDEQDLEWSEQLHLDLPWNFKSNISYNLSKDTIKSAVTAPATATNQSNDTSRFIASLTHRLFRSLTTNFTYSSAVTTSEGGQSSGDAQSAAVTYTKMIPGGVLTLGGSGSIATTANNGPVTSLNEVHTAKATGADFFTLQQGTIDQTSITIDVVAPQSGFTFLLTNNVNYRIDTVGNAFRITILTLNGIAGFTPDPDPNYVYSFKVTYSSTSGKFGLRTTSTGYSAGLQLFNNLVNPYYSYSLTSQNVVSGFYPGGPQSYSDSLAGVRLQKGYYSLQSEYETFQSTSHPYTAWRQRLGFGKKLTPSLSFSAGVSYALSNYSQSVQQNAYTEKVESANITVRKTFLSNLIFSLNVATSMTNGLVSSTSLSFNSTLTWRLGRLYLEGGATNQRTDSGSGLSKEQTSAVYYYLKMRRQLF